MSNQTSVFQRRICAVLVALLAVGPPGYAGEVDGRGYAAWQRPPTADQPPAHYTEPEYEHDVESGEVFDLVDHYELYQGPLEDEKQRWKDTDYINWTVNGATLRAKGQVHDGDYHQATIARSEAWGAQYVDARVTEEEGTHGTIEAENRLSFRYSYLISGRYVGEASVQLNGTAYDMKRKEHHFHLNEQSGESVEAEEGKRSESELRVGLAGGRTLVISNQGAQGKLESHAELEYEQAERVDVRISRRFRQSPGSSGSTPVVVLHDEVSGATPLEEHYEVFSEGDVTLRARAGRVPGTDESSEVLVRLDEFRIENTLRVWTTASWSRPPPGDPGDVPPAPTPEPTGPITPGAGAGGGSSGDEPECGPDETDGDEPEEETPDDPGEAPVPEEDEAPAEAPAETPQDEPAEPDEPDGTLDETVADAGVVTLPVDADPPVKARGGCVAPFGLGGEPGSFAGRLRIELSAPAPCDLRFAVAVEPAGVLAPAAPEIVVPAGQTNAGVHAHGIAPGRADVALRLLDGNGAPTGTVLSVPVETTSVSVRSAPRLWAALDGKARADRRGASVRALPATDLGPLRIGRTGFAGFFDTATTVRLEVDDPDGVLATLPSSVDIPPGTELVEVPLRLTPVPGAATVTLSCDDGQRIPIRVRSVAQAWCSVPRVRVPVGCGVRVPVLFAESEVEPRVIEAASDSEASAAVEGASAALPGGRLGGVWVHGVAPGATTLRLRAPGLTELAVAVEVVEPVVRLSAGALEIDALDPAAEGEIVLWLPPGARVEALDVPAELADVVDAQGVGTGQVAITFAADPDLPERLVLPLRFGGMPEGAFAVDVLDTVHAGADDVLHTVQIEVD